LDFGNNPDSMESFSGQPAGGVNRAIFGVPPLVGRISSSGMESLPPPLRAASATEMWLGRRRLVYFGGCDYLRLSHHPAVRSALVTGLRKFGLHVAASRTTTGNHEVYERLERALARFFGARSALLVSSGYVTNMVVAQALAGEFTHVLIDERAHPSLKDAALFFGCSIHRFEHQRAEVVARFVRRVGRRARPILLTDGLFAADGSVAPLKAYLRVLPKMACVLVDDAHGAGVVGRTGKGSLEHEEVSRARVIQTITLSKALGAYGGAVLGETVLRRRIIQRSGLFTGTTPVPLPLAAAALASMSVLRSDRARLSRLRRNAGWLKVALRKAGLGLTPSPGPIVPITPRDARAAQELKRVLLASGILPPFLKYPGSPRDGYFRFVISSEHTRKQLENLAGVLIANRERIR
jgi:7-keto-8-aminopelargonate synthetase-like enzyme